MEVAPCYVLPHPSDLPRVPPLLRLPPDHRSRPFAPRRPAPCSGAHLPPSPTAAAACHHRRASARLRFPPDRTQPRPRRRTLDLPPTSGTAGCFRVPGARRSTPGHGRVCRRWRGSAARGAALCPPRCWWRRQPRRCRHRCRVAPLSWRRRARPQRLGGGCHRRRGCCRRPPRARHFPHVHGGRAAVVWSPSFYPHASVAQDGAPRRAGQLY